MIQSFGIALLALMTLLPSTALGQDQKLTPDELYQRMLQSASIHADTAYGWYIERVYNAPKDHPEIDDAIKAIEAARAQRAARGESLKGEPDIASIREHLEGVAKQTTHTLVQTYYVSGNRFRMDQSKLPNDQPLEQLRALVLERGKERPPESVTLSDGQGCKQLDYFDDKAKDGQEAAARKAVLKLLPEAPKLPAFLSFGREVTDASLLKTLRGQKMPLRVQQVKTKGGEDALALKIGADGTVGFWLEMIVLPGKGYAITESTAKVQGAVVLREKYDQFVQTSAGFWIPMRIKKESYKLSSLGVPELSARQELLAVEPPKVNLPIDEKLFDVKPTKGTLVMDELHGGGTLIPLGPPLPGTIPGPVSPPRPRSGSRLLLVVLNVLFILGLLGVFIWRKWRQRRRSV